MTIPLRLCAIAVVILATGCSSTKQFADVDFTPPQGDYSLIVMRPDVSVGLYTAGGMVEARQEWTDAARVHILDALQRQQMQRGAATKIATTLAEAGGDPQMVSDLDKLHNVVGQSINLHKYEGAKLPSKKDRFDWTLGQTAVEYGVSTGYDYALFLTAEDSFASSGRVALRVFSIAGCALTAICLIPEGGQHAAYASLIDLTTGKIVWYNVLSSSVGDIRTPEGAQKIVTQLLDKMKPGTNATAQQKRGD